MVRPEQLILDESGATGVPSVVRSYEYFGHDAVVRVQPEIAGLPELVVRITGADPLVPGHPGRRLGARRRRGLAFGRPRGPLRPPESPSGSESRTRNYLIVLSAEVACPPSVSTGGAMAEVPTTDVGGFHGPQVCGLVGITYRQLDYWARTGLLQPSVTAARGSGTRRVYSYSDVLELKVIKQLLDAGVSLQSARRAVECLREDLGADVASSNLVLTGTARCWPAPTARWWTSWPEGRACSTSFRSPAWSTSSKPTSCGSTSRPVPALGRAPGPLEVARAAGE